MRGALRLAANDVKLTLRDRASFFWMLLFPVAMMWLFGSVMGGGASGPPRTTLTVDVRDDGWLAQEFVRQLSSPGVRLQIVGHGAEGPVERQVRTIVLPEGFTAKVLAGEPQKLRLERDKDADEDFSRAAEVHVIKAIARTLAVLVEMNADGALADPAADAAPGRFRELSSREPLVRLEVSTAGSGKPVPRGIAQSVPGTLTMIVLMMTVIYGGVFLTLEKRGGVLRRQLTLPLRRAEVFAGKLCGRLAIAAVQIVLLLAAGRWLFRLEFGDSPVALATLLAAYAFCVAGLATLFGAILKTPEQAASVGWIASMVMAALGGCWWPGEIVPRWLWKAAHVFPTTWAMDGFHALISFGRGLEGVALPAAVLVAMGGVFTGLGAKWLDPSAG